MSFRREKYVPFGGPDGGDGGDGGSIYIVGDGGLATLQGFRYKKQFRAGTGGHGKGKNMHGRRGRDLFLKVPLGTQVWRTQGAGSDLLIADVVEQGQDVLVAKGGKGGLGNTHFATPTNQAPRISEEGKPGEEVHLLLDLKLIADVGIIGCPNAGKSTLLGAVSKARPKIADYPFTTLEPFLGIVEIGYESLVLADIPGLIEGAHHGLGLGLEFLRHIERTRVLIQLVDGSADNPLSDLRNVENELVLYEASLKEKMRIIAVNKVDLPEVQNRLPQLRRQFRRLGIPVYFISAATGEGVWELMGKAMEMISQAGEDVPVNGEKEQFKVFRPRPLTKRNSMKSRSKHG